MKLFHLDRPHDDYAVTVEMLVSARTELEARTVAGRHEHKYGRPERAFGWVDEDVTTLAVVGLTDPAAEDAAPCVLMTKESHS